MGSQEIEPKELLLKTGNDIRIVVEHVPQENPIMTLIVSGKRYTDAARARRATRGRAGIVAAAALGGLAAYVVLPLAL